MGYRSLFCGLILMLGVATAEEIKVPTRSRPVNDDAAALAQLEKPIALDVLETDLASGLKEIADHAGVKLILEKGENEEIWLAPVDFKFDAVRPLDLLNALANLYELQYRAEARGLVIQRKKPVLPPQAVTLRLYDVDDLCHSEQRNGFDCLGLDHNNDPIENNSSNGFTPTNIADMIRNRVRPDLWDAALGTSIEERGGRLVVMQQDDVHAEIRALLSAFRATQNRQVSVDCRFLSVLSVDVDRIRADADARGLSRPALDDAALNALQDLVRNGSATQIFSKQSLGHNMQDCWIQNLRQVRSVSDYDVSGNTFDPVARTRFMGASLLCRPVLSDDGAMVSLNLRASHSTLLGSEDLLVSRGGIIQKSDEQNSKITLRKKNTSVKKAAEGDAAAPEKAKAEAAVDTTDEFEIEQNEAPRVSTLPASGPLYCQLLTMGFSKVSQELRMRTGQTVSLSMPMHGAHGIEPGRELLLLVRADFIRAGRERLETPPPVLPAPSENVVKLMAKPITLKLENVTAQVALECIAKASGLPLFMPAQSIPFKNREEVVTIEAKDQPAGEVLQQVLDAARCGTLAYNSLLLVTVRENLPKNKVVLRIHDVRDMTTTVMNYPDWTFSLPQDRTTSVAANPFNPEPSAATLGAADLATLLSQRLFPQDFSSPVTAIEESNGTLVVMNSPEVQEKIAAKLNELSHSIRRSVAMNTRWAVVDTGSLEAALGRNVPAILDAAQSAKVLALIAGAGARDLSAARFVCQHGQRVSCSGGTHRDAILDYDYSGSLPDPVAGGYYCGAMADFRAYFAEEIDGVRRIRIETRLALSNPDLKPKRWDPFGPGGKPSLGYPVAPGLFENAANDYVRVMTSVTFPDGGAALFRMSPPEWIEGENAEALGKGERTLIVVVQGTQQRLDK